MERHLVVGLGNPEPRYAKNRHNVGFMVVDQLAADERIDLGRSKFNAAYGAGTVEQNPVVLLEPRTFMNLSGRAVAPAARFFGVEPNRIVVVHDELDLPFGRLRLKVGGGHAGHNGLRSIIADLGSREFLRLRVGIGRPVHGAASDYVLADFSAEERPWLPDLLERAVGALRAVLREGVDKAMNAINAT
ncbi:MAG: aminoacyl-tRNA hydrolase [Myxococcales bacterium]|nr:aminoacyl-tRNA hydrolase [Myxococcales bacterium]